MRLAAALFSFVGAFLIGAVPGYLLDWGPEEKGHVSVTYQLTPMPSARTVDVQAADLVGVWKGSWGYERDTCTIEIDRFDGVKFYGTLRKEGAVITLEGYIDPALRRVHFKETRVVRLGPSMSMWSLGLNAGRFSPDGRTLSGEGTDEFGTYGWNVTKSE